MSIAAFAGGVITSLITNLVSDKINPDLLKRITPNTALQNHHLEKAVETAYLRAVESLVADCLGFEGEIAFQGWEREWLEGRRTDLQRRIKAVPGARDLTPPLSTLEEVANLVTPASHVAAEARAAAEAKLLAQAVEKEAPERFRTYAEKHLYERVVLFFCDTLKHDSAVNNIFQGQILSTLSSLAQASHDLLNQILPLLHLILARLPQPAPEAPRLPHVAAIPHPFNPNFTGRDDLLATIRERLTARGRHVLHGIGGVGKTQLAVQYAHRHAGQYGAIFWIKSEGRGQLDAEYLALADRLRLRKEADLDQTIQNVREWFATAPDCLLIFDNANSPAELAPFLPGAGSAHVLITSRYPHWREAGIEAPSVPTLTADAAAEFLQKRSGRREPDGALALAKELDGLPLALQQAGAYIEQTRITFAEYLTLYLKHRQALLEEGEKPADYPYTVGTTWEIAFRKLSPAAAALLNLVAFLAPDAIPVDLVLGHPDQVPEPLLTVLQNPLERNRLLKGLSMYSLITHHGESFSVHRLVQQVVRERLAAEGHAATWAEAAVDVVWDAFPDDVDTPAAWPLAGLLAPHALAACDEACQQGLPPARPFWLYNEVARLYQKQGAFREAERLYRLALAIARRRDDKEDLAVGRHNLGGLLSGQNRLPEARDELEQSLRLRGPDDPKTAYTLTALATVLQAQGDLEAARFHHEKALRIFRTARGEESDETAMALNNLASLLFQLEDYQGACTHLEHAYQISHDLVGDDHPDTIHYRRNLGGALTDLKRWDEALTHLTGALESATRLYGLDHPETAQCQSYLGPLHLKLGALPQARTCFATALPLLEKYFGPDHPDTTFCRETLAKLPGS